tara:strand:- start:1179 stop:3302 length:2124 start_codon:yes stop_codon:yes gene_type:complete
MDLENVYVADCETDGLYKTVSKMHVFSIGWKSGDKWNIKSTNKREDVEKVLCNPKNTVVMHNGRRYDKPVLEKIFGFTVTATIIDSLALSWWLYPTRAKEGKKFGLASFGEDYGVPKPKVEDDEWSGLDSFEENAILNWEQGTPITNFSEADYKILKKVKEEHYQKMVHRCSSDVKINILLWEDLKTKLNLMYQDNPQEKIRLIKLLNWIMDCSFMQEVQGVKVDVEKTEENLTYFESLKEEKIQQLIEAMPKIPIKVKRVKPKNMFKKDGSLSVAGEKWMFLINGCSLPEDYEGVIEEVLKYEEPNPNSVKQKKEWLYLLGWVPKTFKHNRDKETNDVKIVEQIMTEDKMLCPSVLKLIEKEPAIEAFDGLTVLTHRIGILKSFLKNKDENNMISQGLQALAVTMRWQHSVIVNLPRYTGKGDIRDGNWIRECLIAGKNKKIVQSDLSGIESRTSDHYIFDINPGRVKKTQMPYFDPHCEISVSSSLMTEDEQTFFIFKSALKDEPTLDINTFSELYKPTDEVFRLLSLPDEEQNTILKKLKLARSKGKTCNYASLYNVGAETLGRNLDISKKEAQKLIDAYWEIHYAVKTVSQEFTLKKVGDETWVYNPISRFFYYCRNTKDLFSIVNQSSAVYCFNMWVWNCTQMGIYPVTQSHDDSAYIVDIQRVENTKSIIEEAMKRVNRQLNLKVELACDTQVGKNIAETH